MSLYPLKNSAQFVVNHGSMLAIDGRLVFPDSRKWKMTLQRLDRVSFWGGQSEVDFGYVERRGEGWQYILRQGGVDRRVPILVPYFTWFRIYHIWHIHARLDRPDEDPYSGIGGKQFTDGIFRGFFSLNANHFDEAIFRKLVFDFIEANPESNVLFESRYGRMGYESFCLHDFERNRYGVISMVPFTVTGVRMANSESCFRLSSLLGLFSTGCVYENSFFRENYASKENMFID